MLFRQQQETPDDAAPSPERSAAQPPYVQLSVSAGQTALVALFAGLTYWLAELVGRTDSGDAIAAVVALFTLVPFGAGWYMGRRLRTLWVWLGWLLALEAAASTMPLDYRWRDVPVNMAMAAVVSSVGSVGMCLGRARSASRLLLLAAWLAVVIKVLYYFARMRTA